MINNRSPRIVSQMPAPALPDHYVPRPDVDRELEARLLAKDGAEQEVLAIHGLPGVGKTTSATSLCYSINAQERFEDGILWATLGQEPELLDQLSAWIRALGDHEFRPVTVAIASDHLRTLLAEKACLLVLDDVWQAGHARPFLVGGPRCQVLLTTRDAGLARTLDASLYALDVMTATQALALFEKRLGPAQFDRTQASRLARVLGHLPLALELAAAQIARGVPWDELRGVFEAGLADLAALDLDEAQHRNESVRLSIRLSLEVLSSGDQQAFAWLGVLPEEVGIQPAMASTLWGESEGDVRARLELLGDRALLRRMDTDTYTLHDLLHDEARLRLAEQMPLSQAHAELLARYQAQMRDRLWHTLPDDGYIHEHLTWHMEQAQWSQELHALLSEETPEGRNAWFETRDALGQMAGYLADINRAWRLAERTSDVGLQCCYAFMRASINSLATTLGPEVVVALVDAGLWMPVKGLAYARQVSRRRERAEALAGLLPYLSEPLKGQVLNEALEAARGARGDLYPSKALVHLVPHLPEQHRTRILEEVISNSWPLENGWKLYALMPLLPHMPEPQRARVVNGVLALGKSTGYRSRVLDFVSPPLKAEVVAELLAEAREMEWAGDLALAVADLLPHLSEAENAQVVAEALADARAIEEPYLRADALIGLIPHLPDAVKAEVMAEALADARAIEETMFRAEVLVDLIPHLPEPQRGQVLDETLALSAAIPRQLRGSALAGMAWHLPRSQQRRVLEWALADARRIGDDAYLVWNLAGMVSRVPGFDRSTVLAGVLTASRGVEDPMWRAWSFMELLPLLSDPARHEVLVEAFAAARQIKSGWYRILALLGLLERLPAATPTASIDETGARGPSQADSATDETRSLREQILAEALAAVESEEWDDYQVKGLKRLAPYLPPASLPQALAIVQGLQSPTLRGAALEGLAPYLSPALLEEAVLIAGDMKQKSLGRTRALAGLTLHLPEELQAQMPQSAVDFAREVRSPHRRVRLLVNMAFHAPDSALPEIVAEARAFRKVRFRADALVRLVSHLPEPLKTQTVDQALMEVLKLETDSQAPLLAELIPHLSESLDQSTVEAALDWRYLYLMPILSAHLADPQREQVLLKAFAESTRWGPQLEAIDRPDLAWISTLVPFGPSLAELPSSRLEPLWHETLTTLAARMRYELAFDLNALMPVVVALGGQEAVTGVCHAIQAVRHWWP